MKTQFNNPNYKALVLVFAPGSPYTLCNYEIEQVCSPSKAGLEKMNDSIVSHVEGQRDRLGLEFRVCLPGDPKKMHWEHGTRRVDIS